MELSELSSYLCQITRMDYILQQFSFSSMWMPLVKIWEKGMGMDMLRLGDYQEQMETFSTKAKVAAVEQQRVQG